MSIDSAAKLVGIVAAIVGATFGIYKFLDIQETETENRALQYIKEYDSAPLLTARSKINEALYSTDIDPQNINLINQLIRDEFLEVALFFDRLLDCVESDLCDRELVGQNFQLSSGKLIDDLGPYLLALRRSRSDNFGRGLVGLADTEAQERFGQLPDPPPVIEFPSVPTF